VSRARRALATTRPAVAVAGNRDLWARLRRRVHALAELDEWLPRADVVASRPPPRGGGERRLSGWAHGPGAL